MALNPEGTDPDREVLRRILSIQVAEPCTDRGQQVALHVSLAAHRNSIVVMALSAEGIDPDNRGDRRTSREVSDCIDDGNVPASPFCLKSLHATLIVLRPQVRTTYSMVRTPESQPTPFQEQ